MYIKRLSLLSLVLFSSMASAVSLDETACKLFNSADACFKLAYSSGFRQLY